MTKDDLSIILNWRNSKFVRNKMRTQHNISLEEHEKWFAKCTENELITNLIYEENGVPLGYIQFKRKKNKDVCEWGFYKAPDSKAGLGSNLLKEGIEYAFDKLGVNKIKAEVLADNIVSNKVHEKLGFYIVNTNFINIDVNISTEIVYYELFKETWYENRNK